MTQRKNPNVHGTPGSGGVMNAIRKLYDPVLDEPIPQFLLDAASMSRQEAAAASAKKDGAEPAAPAETPKSDSNS
ncbi:MAG TPA: hypothetical protein VGO34_07830 [Alphaproteobacteria bacterium]